MDTLYNHLWEPKGNLWTLCAVCLNPQGGWVRTDPLSWGQGRGGDNEHLKSSLGNKRGLEQLNIFLLVRTLERSVLPWLGPSPGCTWTGFNPRIGLYKKKGWVRRAPGWSRGEEPSRTSLWPRTEPGCRSSVCPFKVSCKAGSVTQLLPCPQSRRWASPHPSHLTLSSSLEAHERETGRRAGHPVKSLLSPE